MGQPVEHDNFILDGRTLGPKLQATIVMAAVCGGEASEGSPYLLLTLVRQ